MLPSVDGLTLCQRLRRDERTSNIPILMITALGGLKDKVTGFNKGNKSTTKSIKDSSSDREGIATLDNQAGNYDEYILLLQKLQSGNISDSERNRFNVLKNRLGI